MQHALAQPTMECAKSNSVTTVTTNIKVKPVGTWRPILATYRALKQSAGWQLCKPLCSAVSNHLLLSLCSIGMLKAKLCCLLLQHTPNFSFFFFFFTMSQQLLFTLAITPTFEAATKTKFKVEGLLSKHLKNWGWQKITYSIHISQIFFKWGNSIDPQRPFRHTAQQWLPW